MRGNIKISMDISSNPKKAIKGKMLNTNSTTSKV